ncbi:MAG: hypothetical protein V3W09_03860, partial [Nitrososphaerales archaeon]
MDLKRGLIIISAILIVASASLAFLVYNQSSEITTLTDAKSELESDKANIIGKISELEEDIVEIRTLVNTLEEELADAKSSNQELKDEIGGVESDKLQLEADIKNRELRIVALEKELADAKTEISDLNDLIIEYLGQITDLSVPIDQRHLNQTIFATQDCSQCHGPVAEQAVRGESNEKHNIHLNNILLNFGCTDCHKSVDILSSSENLTRIVDIDTCKGCHTTFPTKIWMGYPTPPEAFALQFSDCIQCHDDWREEMAEASYVNIDSI